jgi:hypothetical protein
MYARMSFDTPLTWRERQEPWIGELEVTMRVHFGATLEWRQGDHCAAHHTILGINPVFEGVVIQGVNVEFYLLQPEHKLQIVRCIGEIIEQQLLPEFWQRTD